MKPFQNILVDVDATASRHPALERAVPLARRSGARLTITDVMTIPSHARRYLPAGFAEEMIKRRRDELAQLAHTVRDVPTEAKLLDGRPATVLIQEVLRSNHDLLMRSHGREATAARPRPFGAVDMELLRACPCPVFLVQQGEVDQHPQIVGAVDASAEVDSGRALNVKIAELTVLMAELENGAPTLVHAWAPFGERMVRSHSPDEAFAGYVEKVREQAAADLGELVQSFCGRLPGVQALQIRGTPEDIIPAFAVEHGIDLVVMGTVARTGVAGFFIGNTAERVLRNLPCCVLAVKPDGFASPVGLDCV
jgi:universal stress protein E